jgi:hypothetical protein
VRALFPSSSDNNNNTNGREKLSFIFFLLPVRDDI